MPQKRYFECPFCSGLVEPKPGRQKCPECHVGFVYDETLQSVFVDTTDVRLPIHGTVCTRCGMVQSEKVRRCGHCGGEITDTQH
jgi:RNA polymerase subunit RPABC4/transcription elongation factor Spt4